MSKVSLGGSPTGTATFDIVAPATNTNRTITLPDQAGTVFVGESPGAAPMFACRAWVNFDGTRNVTNTGASTNGQPVFIRASGNVTGVVKNGVGDYTINFTTAMPDSNYAVAISNRDTGAAHAYSSSISNVTAPTTTAVRIKSTISSPAVIDTDLMCVAIFR